MIDIIYCADNEPYGTIAKEYIEVGTQLPNRVYFDDIRFADQDWRNPDRPRYLEMLRKHKPKLATVLDWELPEQCHEVLGWAEDAAQYVDTVIIIPKCMESIEYLNQHDVRTIGGKEVRLGYSVPTSHGGTDLLIDSFYGWPVHALGGSPKNQLALACYADVRSADGNYIHHKIKHGQFFDGVRWLQLRDRGYNVPKPQIPETVLRLSFPNYVSAWKKLYTRKLY